MKNKYLKFLPVTLIVLLSVGCSIKQEVYFNKDFSGKYKYAYDFTEYVKMMEDEEDSDSLMMKNEDFEEYLNAIVMDLKNINGISNVKYLNDADNGLVYFQYDFDNVDALNKGLEFSSYLGQEPLENPPYFELKRKKLTFNRPVAPKKETDEDQEFDFSTEDSDYMNNMFLWEFTIEFDRNVKKYNVQKDTAVSVSANKRKFVEKGNVFDVVEKETKWVFKTK